MVLDFYGQQSLLNIMMVLLCKIVANHGEEMFLLFPGSPAVGTNSPHFNRSRDMVRLWTQFATGG